MNKTVSNLAISNSATLYVTSDCKHVHSLENLKVEEERMKGKISTDSLCCTERQNEQYIVAG
jgi:hypothetical protein